MVGEHEQILSDGESGHRGFVPQWEEVFLHVVGMFKIKSSVVVTTCR